MGLGSADLGGGPAAGTPAGLSPGHRCDETNGLRTRLAGGAPGHTHTQAPGARQKPRAHPEPQQRSGLWGPGSPRAGFPKGRGAPQRVGGARGLTGGTFPHCCGVEPFQTGFERIKSTGPRKSTYGYLTSILHFPFFFFILRNKHILKLPHLQGRVEGGWLPWELTVQTFTIFLKPNSFP